MDFLDRVDVVVLTYNEEANLGRTLEALRRFPRVAILDSGSTDATRAIAARHPNVRWYTHPFEDHATQWSWALDHCELQAEWVLALDADYVLDAGLVDEIAALSPPPDLAGWIVRFRYCVLGRPLSASLYPPAVVLYRRAGARYVQDGHAHRLVPGGRVLPLRGRISHDDRKAFTTWLAAQDRYARMECDALLGARWSELRWRDRIRRMVVVAPWLVPLYCLVVGRGLLDGKAGVFYALQRAIAESILSARLVEAMLTGRPAR